MRSVPRPCLHWSLVGLAVAGGLAVASAARAEVLTVHFTGVISPLGSFLDPTGNFSKGEAISGFWTFETTTPDGDADPKRGAYPQTGAPAFRIDIGAHSFSSGSTTIQILDDYTTGIGTIDAYDVLGGAGTSSIVGLTVNQVQITLRDTEAPLNAQSSDALPTGAPNPASFDQVGQSAGQITGTFGGSDFFMNLEIRTTELVPEPSGMALLLAGLGLLGLGRERTAVRA